MSKIATYLFDRKAHTWHRLPSIDPLVLRDCMGQPVLLTDMYWEKGHDAPICAWRVVPDKPRKGRMNVLAFLYNIPESRVEEFRRKNNIRLVFACGGAA